MSSTETPALLDLRASAAMRREDLRIASKHREEAGARTMSPANKAAYERALRWEAACREAAEAAGGALIRASLPLLDANSANPLEASIARLRAGGR